MKRRMEQIAEFADIGDFINYPVKTYSSGMFVRLAFACAIHVDPDILIIDEALPVGDVKFQKKCYDHLNKLIEGGCTVLIVTHGRIREIAQSGLVLDHGRTVFSGSSAEADLRYLRLLYPEEGESGLLPEAVPSAEEAPAPVEKAPGEPPIPVGYCLQAKVSECKIWGIGGAWVESFEVQGLAPPNLLRGGEELVIDAHFGWDSDRIREVMADQRLPARLIFGIEFQTVRGLALSAAVTTYMEQEYGAALEVNPLARSGCCLRFRLQLPRLAAGDYFLSPAIALGTQERHVRLRTYENLVHLTCVPLERHVFGLMTWPANITLIEPGAADHAERA